MDITVTRSMFDPAADDGDRSGLLPPVEEVAYLSVEARRKPAFYGYDAMLEAAYAEVASTIDRLEARGFRAYVFLVGANLTLEQVGAVPHYDLWSLAHRCGLEHREALMEDLFQDGHRRRVGLYRIDMSDLSLACVCQSRANSCVIALSADRDFLSRPVLMRLFEAARPEPGRRSVSLYWGYFARHLCDAGHVLLQEFGAFDDLYRTLTLCVPRLVWDAMAR